MRLVGTDSPHCLAPVVATHSLNESDIVLGHADGTVSVFASGELTRIWLNPGRRVLAVTGFDQSVFVSFADAHCAQFSLNTGLRMHSVALTTQIEQVAVFEEIIVGWSRYDLSLTLLYRFNLEPFADLVVESYVVNVFRSQGRLLVVCASHIYELKPKGAEKFSYHCELVSCLPGTMIIDAQPFQKSFCLISTRSWSLASLSDDGKLEYAFEVDSPGESALKRAHIVTSGIVIVSGDEKMVVLHHNNIQLVDLPFKKHQAVFSVGDSCFMSDTMEVFRLYIESSEFKWEQIKLPVQLGLEQYLVGETDPTLTAKYGDLCGYSNGYINDSPVFLSPVLKIDGTRAYSREGSVCLPLSEINLITPTKSKLTDSRVSIPVRYPDANNYQSYRFIGSESPDHTYWALQPFQSGDELSPSIATMLVYAQFISSKTALERMTASTASVLILENMAIAARESSDSDMLKVVASFLTKLWTPDRLTALLNSSNARSLRVLASVMGYVNLSDGAFLGTIERKLDSTEVCVCDAVLAVYELNLPQCKSLPLPFSCLEYVSSKRIRRFAQNLVKRREGRALDSIADGLRNTQNPANGHRSIASLAALLLLECLSLNLLPQSEEQLIEIVRMVLPTLRSRVLGAKEVFVKLISCHKLMYHKLSQRLLVHTPENPQFMGIVFDMKNENGSEYKLKNPAQEIYSINFGSDGSSVIGIGPHTKVLWAPAKKTFAFFGSESNEIAPQEFL